MKKSTLIFLCVVAALTVFAACGRSQGSQGTDGIPLPPPEAADWADELTFLGTRRGDTLIVELQFAIENPGIFNTFNGGAAVTSGIVQLLTGNLWNMNTITGEQFPEIAAAFPRSSDDFMTHYIDIRPGIYWTDGRPLTAHDVAFTMNMVRDDPSMGLWGYFNAAYASIEAVEEYVVRIETNYPYMHMATQLGVTVGGNAMRVKPAHIYSQIENVTAFADENPVVAGAYTVHSFDPLGTWVLYERRPDWERSIVSVVSGGMEPMPKFVLFRSFGDDTVRQMAMINNEMDLMMEVSLEMLQFMSQRNPRIGAWYDRFPFATSDDPVAKGLVFNHAVAPYDNRYFRWGIALALDFDMLSMAIFEGAGRASPFPIFTMTSGFIDMYYRPYLMEWIDDFYIDLADGTRIYPYDRGYAERIANIMRGMGHDLPTDPDELRFMFGYGTWKHDPDAARQLFQMAGLELRDGGWYFEGQPFVMNMTYLAGTELQTERSVIAAFNQLQQFGFNATLAGKTIGAWAVDWGLGNFQIDGYWPWACFTQNVFGNVQTFDRELITPVGEWTNGAGMRWDNVRATEMIHELRQLPPTDPRVTELAIEFFQVSVHDLPAIGFHSGLKFVPTNSTFWHGYPSANNPINGPWWWWHVFDSFLPYITPFFPSE
jgi:peptide/nickel transport system substrate-binding protein